MLEEDDVIVWVEERLDSISTVDGIKPFFHSNNDVVFF